MSRVIKAGQVRFVEAESSERHKKNAGLVLGETMEDTPKDIPQDQAENLRTAMQEARQQQDEEFKAAYDELIAAAQDEVALRLEDAQNEAQTIVREAKIQSEEIRHNAFETGLSEGRRKAEQEAQDFLERARTEADATVRQAEQERQKVISETEPMMYRLALDIAEKILKYELNANEDAYMGILGNAINHVRTEGTVTLHVNAAEYSRFFGNQDKTKLRTDEGMVAADVVVDPSVEPGGCLIETDSGVVDASVGVQLEQIAQGLGFESS